MSSNDGEAVSDLQAARRLLGSGAVLCVGGSMPSRALGEWFERCTVTDSAEEALALLNTDRALAVVEAGPEGLRFVREASRTYPRLAVVAVASPADSALLVELINFGIRSVVPTPIDENLLLERVYRELTAVQDFDRDSQYLTRLENEVRMRTEELREAQVQVVRLQEAKDNMLALISHEIRTPLNGILGFIDLLRSPEFSADAKAFLVHVEESARRLERSTRKAIDFVTLSTGLKSIRHARHRVRALLEAAQEQLGSRGGRVAYEGAEILDTDGELLVQVFRNLLENTAKYGGASPLITVNLTREGRWDVLSFQDNGPGFSPSVLATLFQPFSTGGILHHSEGMGLGLALIDVIMLTLGGRAEAGNASEGGAQIKLRFPVREQKKP